MIHSMTGFGRSTAEAGGTCATVELRSVNKRHFETSLRAPRALSEREAEMQAYLKARFERGRITAQVQIDEPEPEALPVVVDEAAARAYAGLLRRLRTAAGLDAREAPIHVDHLLHFSDVLTTPDEDAATCDGDAWAAAERALHAAADALEAMRRQEGEALRRDLEGSLRRIAEGLEAVEARAPERIAAARARLRERLDEIFADERVATERLEAEIAALADRLDLNEECVRLRSHLDLFRQALDSGEPVGRKLRFLVQEVHREVNTIGAKANDAAIAHHVVAMKEEVEKIREQVENVE